MAALNLVAEDSGVFFPVYDSTGAPADLSGFTVRAQIRTKADDDDVLFEFSTTASTITLAPGVITLRWTREQILALEVKHGVADLLLTDLDGVDTLVPIGSVSVHRGVTR